MEEKIRMSLTLPSALHERLKAEAKKNHRSLQAELVHRLEFSLGLWHGFDDTQSLLKR